MAIPDFQKITLLAVKSVQSTLVSERDALANLAAQYLENIDCQVELVNALRLFYETHLRGGKIVACGVGKSYKIATKTVATLKSLSISTDILHPTEALHGDLGLITERDCLFFFTASGNTPELLALLPHIPALVPIVLLSCNRESKLSKSNMVKSLLQIDLPDHLKETTVHGVPAPTVSTTLQLVMADSVVLALAEMIENDHIKRKKKFSMKHPGGSIGSDLSHLNDNLLRRESPSTSASSGSCSSLLSLDQLRECIQRSSVEGGASNETISLDLDSESLSVHSSDVVLSVQIKNTSQNAIKKYDIETLRTWTEVEFLKNIALYDYIICQDGTVVSACKSSDLRTSYKSKISQDGALWESFEPMLKEFHIIEL